MKAASQRAHLDIWWLVRQHKWVLCFTIRLLGQIIPNLVLYKENVGDCLRPQRTALSHSVAHGNSETRPHLIQTNLDLQTHKVTEGHMRPVPVPNANQPCKYVLILLMRSLARFNENCLNSPASGAFYGRQLLQAWEGEEMTICSDMDSVFTNTHTHTHGLE